MTQKLIKEQLKSIIPSDSYEVVAQMFVRFDVAYEIIQSLASSTNDLFFITLCDLRYQIEDEDPILHIDPLVNETGKNPKKYYYLYDYFNYTLKKLFQYKDNFPNENIYIASVSSYDPFHKIYKTYSQNTNSNQHKLLFFFFNGNAQRSSYKQDISYNIQDYSQRKQYNLRAFITRGGTDKTFLYKLFMKIDDIWYEIKGNNKKSIQNIKFFLEKAEIIMYSVDEKYSQYIMSESSYSQTNSKSTDISKDNDNDDNINQFIFNFTNIIENSFYTDETITLDLREILKENKNPTLYQILNKFQKNNNIEFPLSFYFLKENSSENKVFGKIEKTNMTLEELSKNGYLDPEKGLSIKKSIDAAYMQTIRVTDGCSEKYFLMHFQDCNIKKKEFIDYLRDFLKTDHQIVIPKMRRNEFTIKRTLKNPIIVRITE